MAEIFMILCDKVVTSIADIDVALDLPNDFNPNSELPPEICETISDLEWDVEWSVQQNLKAFYDENE